MGDESEAEENDEEFGREGQVTVITLYGVDQTVGRAVMVGGVGEGEGRRGTEDPSGMSNLHAGVYEEGGRHVGKRMRKLGSWSVGERARLLRR